MYRRPCRIDAIIVTETFRGYTFRQFCRIYWKRTCAWRKSRADSCATINSLLGPRSRKFLRRGVQRYRRDNRQSRPKTDARRRPADTTATMVTATQYSDRHKRPGWTARSPEMRSMSDASSRCASHVTKDPVVSDLPETIRIIRRHATWRHGVSMSTLSNRIIPMDDFYPKLRVEKWDKNDKRKAHKATALFVLTHILEYTYLCSHLKMHPFRMCKLKNFKISFHIWKIESISTVKKWFFIRWSICMLSYFKY